MKLKMQLDNLEGLDESLHQFYTEQDGKFVLDVEGGEDTGALKRSKEHEKNLRKIAEAKVADLTNQLTDVEAKVTELTAANGDISKLRQTLDASWQQKLDAIKADSNAKIETLNGNLQRILVDNVAHQIATDVSTAPELLLPHVKSRLKVELVDGEAITRVVDKDGNESALSIDELKQEYVANPKYSAIIIGSKGSGGGAEKGSARGGASKAFKDMSEAERVDYARRDPAGFKRDAAAAKQAAT